MRKRGMIPIRKRPFYYIYRTVSGKRERMGGYYSEAEARALCLKLNTRAKDGETHEVVYEA